MNRDEFELPDMSRPLDVAAVIAACPQEARAKGMFIAEVIEQVTRHGVTPPTTRRYHVFTDYPLRDFVEVAPACAALIYPDVPLREALRRLGRSAYPTVANTRIGRVAFGMFKDNVRGLLRLSTKGYGLSLSVGRAEAIEVSDDYAVVRLTDIYNYIDSYHVGVHEGILSACRVDGEVRIKARSDTSADLLLSWTSR